MTGGSGCRVRRPARLLVVLAVSLALVGCAQATALRAGAEDKYQLGSAPYRIGPLTVMILPQAEVQEVCGAHARAPEGQRILGCYISDSRTLVAVPDPHVLVHELKHHLDGAFH